MRKIIHICIGVLMVTRCFAQPGITQIPVKERALGRNLKGGEPINGVEYLFQNRIHEFYLDTTSNLVTIQTRGLNPNGKTLVNKGEVLLCDLNAAKIRWHKGIRYTNTYLEQLNSLIIETSMNKSFVLNRENGIPQWQITYSVYRMDPMTGMGVGYEPLTVAKKYHHLLKGFRISDGAELWSRPIDREFGWNDSFYLNDSVMVVVSSGIHTVDLKSGRGWDYAAITGKNDYTGMVAANVAGLALGVLTGTFIMTPGHNTVRGIVSNVVMDSSYFYFASTDKIACIEKTTGRVKWTQPLQKDLVSNSTLYIKNNKLYLVNNGYAFMGARQVSYGKPFITAFHTETGNQLFFNLIPTNDFVLRTQIKGESISLLFKNNMMKYALADGSMMAVGTFESNTYGDLKSFVGRQVYLSRDSLFGNLIQSDTTKHFVSTTKGRILILNERLKEEGQIDTGEVYIRFGDYRDYTFLAKGDKTVVVNQQMRGVAELDVSHDAIIIDQTLLEAKGTSIKRIDLNEVFRD